MRFTAGFPYGKAKGQLQFDFDAFAAVAKSVVECQTECGFGATPERSSGS